MSTFKTLMQKFANKVEIVSRHRVRNELLSMTGHQLRDLGYSRYLLEKGTDFWPWRLDEVQIQADAHKFAAKIEATATPCDEKAAA